MTINELEKKVDDYKTLKMWVDDITSVMLDNNKLTRTFRVMGDDKGDKQFVSFELDTITTLKIIEKKVDKLIDLGMELKEFGVNGIKLDTYHILLKSLRKTINEHLLGEMKKSPRNA